MYELDEMQISAQTTAILSLTFDNKYVLAARYSLEL